jgi:hypothetical protein
MNSMAEKGIIFLVSIIIALQQPETALAPLGINTLTKTNEPTPIVHLEDLRQTTFRFTRIGGVFDEITTVQLDFAPDKTGVLTCKRGAIQSTPKIDTSFPVSEIDGRVLIDLLDNGKFLNMPEKYNEKNFSPTDGSCLTPYRDYVFEGTYKGQRYSFERTKRMESYLCNLVALLELLCLPIEQSCAVNAENAPLKSGRVPYYAPMIFHDVLSGAVEVLHKMREPSLFERSQEPKQISIRVTCIGHYRDNFSVRLDVNTSGSGILYYKQLTSEMILVKNRKRPINPKQVSCFMSYLEHSNFMNIPKEYRDEKLAPGERYVVADGDSYLFETVINGKYHCFERSEILIEEGVEQLIASLDFLSKPIKGLKFAVENDFKTCAP